MKLGSQIVCVGVCVPDLGTGGTLNDTGELSILTSSKYAVPQFIEKTRRYYKKKVSLT